MEAYLNLCILTLWQTLLELQSLQGLIKMIFKKEGSFFIETNVIKNWKASLPSIECVNQDLLG